MSKEKEISEMRSLFLANKGFTVLFSLAPCGRGVGRGANTRVFKITTSLCINLCSICFLRLALNVTPSLPTSPAGSQSIRQAAPHSAQLA